MSIFRLLGIYLCFGLGFQMYAQTSHTENLKHLDKLLSDKNFVEANKVLKKGISELEAKNSYFLLTDYIYYTGKIQLQLQNPSKATSEVTQFIKTITSSTDSLKVWRQAQLELSTFYELLGDSQKAYDANLEALKLTSKWKDATPEDFGLIENNLGTLSTRKGDLATGVAHHRKALKYYNSYAQTDKKNYYVIYNSLGGSMWFLSKIDSSLYYFEKAEKMLKDLEPNPMNSFYRPATINNNIAAIYSTQGSLDKALEAMRKTITYLNQFLKSDAADTKKETAKEFLYMSIENLAGIYKDIGDFEKAKNLIEYSFKEKKKSFDPQSPELFKAKVLLGQIYLALRDYSKAEKYLEEAITQIKNTNGGNAYWEADAHYYMATLNADLGKIDIAKKEFKISEELYEVALEGAYDEIYLDYVVNASRFYAKNGEKQKALAMAQKAYDYIKKNQGSTTSFEIQQALNLGGLYYELGDYALALDKVNITEELLKKKLPTQNSSLDSTQIIFYKPQTLLLKAQSDYRLNPKESHSIFFLQDKFKTLKEAITIVESQKTLIGDGNNVSILIENNSMIFEFAKQLAIELYLKTKDKNYLNEITSLHESILYNRIRSRLNSKTSMSYNDVPSEILTQEKKIKKNIQTALNESNNIEAFIRANSEWNDYLEMLKKNYPKYYKLRFAVISKSLNDIEQKLPDNTTVIRYVYSDKDLYAVLISKKNTELYKLNPSSISTKIEQLHSNNALFENNLSLLNELYTDLWKPFENAIKTEHIVIIPDRDLFNLNFEMLTAKPTINYKELASNSLLSKYIISYNYSLFLIDKGSKTVSYEDNFVAFVPEFNDKMKSDYQIVIQDSISLDKTYLTLLPQPFTKRLANYSTRLFKGTSFLNENSTEHIFKNNAKEHKIIHIGTHAEANNISPELSRLVFAKSLDSTTTDDNYLYTYEIYNTNLSSNLAILTACETGKPTYQAGEGMISLAHAFNYAGSESILTSLWKIDEQSSAAIIESFYGYIKDGLPKDKALQQAKLDYLETAQGRTAHPQYWAGLVLIGDTAPIEIQTTTNLIFWILGSVVLVIVLMVIIKKFN
ncbi:CHAT domain-containing protein [Subsaxibacter sp. CAU 1640]|uniref:CHAT domain-containing protein n=1 Tax=Subsaxibacter sp. CAU 1640 TaxID=2933271 RepID=UPI0020044B98|nr:CHAT domain-containing tetratricopeptide repeat protein [Subsaxibacter sp. CAU 1640]MCK7589650.1 CHAT domain-containing protein [Subsaxibacter sp. CAU 1640]